MARGDDMRLLQDGVVAALAAIGLTAGVFFLGFAHLPPRPRGAHPAPGGLRDGRARNKRGKHAGAPAAEAASAIGLTAVIFLLVSAIVPPRRRGTIPATAVIETCGEAKTLEYTVRALLRSRYEEGGFSRVVIVDCGLADEPRRVAELLCRSEYEVYLCQREELTDFFT